MSRTGWIYAATFLALIALEIGAEFSIQSLRRESFAQQQRIQELNRQREILLAQQAQIPELKTFLQFLQNHQAWQPLAIESLPQSLSEQGLQVQVEPLQSVPLADHWQMQVLPVTLNFVVAHEEAFSSVLQKIRAVPGWSRLQRCVLERTSEPGLRVRCEYEWLSLLKVAA